MGWEPLHVGLPALVKYALQQPVDKGKELEKRIIFDA